MSKLDTVAARTRMQDAHEHLVLSAWGKTAWEKNYHLDVATQRFAEAAQFLGYRLEPIKQTEDAE